MSYSKKVTVPDTSADMAVDAVQLDAISGGLSGTTRLTVGTAATVWVMHAPAPTTPTAQEVVSGGFPIVSGGYLDIIDPNDGASPQPDPSTYWFATVTGAGDVRAFA